MKLKPGIIVTEADGEYVAVASGAAGRNFGGMIRMNKTTAFIVEVLKKGATEDEIVRAMCEKYDVDAAVARSGAQKVVATLRGAGLIED